MAVEAALTGDPRLVYQAIAYDPLTAAVLSLAEITHDGQRDVRPQHRRTCRSSSILWCREGDQAPRQSGT